MGVGVGVGVSVGGGGGVGVGVDVSVGVSAGATAASDLLLALDSRQSFHLNSHRRSARHSPFITSARTSRHRRQPINIVHADCGSKTQT